MLSTPKLDTADYEAAVEAAREEGDIDSEKYDDILEGVMWMNADSAALLAALNELEARCPDEATVNLTRYHRDIPGADLAAFSFEAGLIDRIRMTLN